MSRTINTYRDPYGEGFTLTRLKKIEINPGLTVLVGCNGAGKTTLLRNIESQLRTENIPLNYYDNLHDGGQNSVSRVLFEDNISLGCSLMTASEGEAIAQNFGSIISKTREFLKTGFMDTQKNRIERLAKTIGNDLEEPEITSNERWLLFDAVDSGLSVDAVIEVVDIFNLIIEDAANFGVEVYIVISANEYELCRGNNCFDVNSGKYLQFKDYEEYRKFILKSRERKNKRYK